MATAEDLITKAAENSAEAVRAIDISDENIDSQLETLEEAKDALAEEDVEEAVRLIQEVQEQTNEQARVNVNEDIAESKSHAIAAAGEGEAEEATEHVDAVTENAKTAMAEAAEKAKEEQEEQERLDRIEQGVEDESDLEVAAGEVNSLLNAADAAIHKENFLRAHQLIEELDAEGDRKM